MKKIDLTKFTGGISESDLGTVPVKRSKFNKRKLILPTIVAILLFAAFVAINNFFNTYFFTFQTPVIFQSPILMHKREVKLLSPIPEGVAHAQEPVEVIKLGVKAQACADKNPLVVAELKKQFGADWQDAVELFCRESSLNPGAINKTSGACGLVQAYPCAKLKCEFADVACQVAWGKDYVSNRYGSAAKAVEFHDQNNWY